MRETLTLDRPEQLKALGHPLRVRTLELLCHDEAGPLTNRELAERLNVDPGHLHFHVRMLLRAGLIELAEEVAQGREKPYRAVARELRVHPDLLASSGAAEAQAALLEDVQRALAKFGESGRFRTVQVSVRMDPGRVFEVVNDALGKLLDEEDPDRETLVVTAFITPPALPDST
jgi:DNA-binding transcriptional ArsR family regulator